MVKVLNNGTGGVHLWNRATNRRLHLKPGLTEVREDLLHFFRQELKGYAHVVINPTADALAASCPDKKIACTLEEEKAPEEVVEETAEAEMGCDEPECDSEAEATEATEVEGEPKAPRRGGRPKKNEAQ